MIFNSNDYPLDKEYRNRQMIIAEHASWIPKRSITRRYFLWPSHHFMIFLFFATVTLFGFKAVGATDDMRRADADASASASIQLALILGDYYFDTAQYPKAIVEFASAIEQIPEQLFQLLPEQAVVFWQLGDAQFMVGYHEEALTSYLCYLELAGSNATPLARTYVHELTTAIQTGSPKTMSILSG